MVRKKDRMKHNQVVTELMVETEVRRIADEAFQFPDLPVLHGETFANYQWRSLAALKAAIDQITQANPVLPSFHPAHLSGGRCEMFFWITKRTASTKTVLTIGDIGECDFDNPVKDGGREWIFVPLAWATEVLDLVRDGVRGFCAANLVNTVDGQVAPLVSRPSFQTFRMDHPGRPSSLATSAISPVSNGLN